ncbi:16S rRNA (guanine(527)-N(7))-methyltransferase RsmG [Candidatus Thiosymbion oneisti]|uniref:16S rRNA (guanine(527)-N(7))-methyltransferase RsmG n=1 Tax=Candidatus Thiosymbion oneisti TaxID=589554 RepID=UPI00210BD699|nr:16S rRNA (guanine(527)-N(7))-methyltransferase RsmG [Candidatus Thiosymbion oneisti]
MSDGVLMSDRGAVRTRLTAGLEQMGIALSGDRTDVMVRYLLLLQRWNRAYNLTAVRAPLEMVSKHLLDSLSVLPYLYGDKLLDLGTGPGLPGIPLAIAAPERTFYLLDSNGKKVRFLHQAVMGLGLMNAVVIRARMEAYLPGREFATIVSRAVASVPDLLGLTARLPARPVRLLAMQGKQPAGTELRGLEPSPDTLSVHPIEVPFLSAERHLIEAHYN